ALEPERRPVELVVPDEPVVLVAAGAGEADAVDDRVRGSRQALERAERGEGDTGLTGARTRERVPTGDRVVHVRVVNRPPDGETAESSVFEQREELVLLQPLAAAEEGEVDHEVDPDHLAAELRDEPGDRLDRPTGG